MAGKEKSGGQKMLGHRAYRRIGAAMPASVLSHFDQKLRFAGIREETRVWLGLRVLLAFCTGSALMLLYLIAYSPAPTLQTSAVILAHLAGGFLLVAIVAYLKLYFQIADRASSVERMLPDFLMLTLSNLRAGMNPFAAFVNASRPEFGDLHQEVVSSTAKVGGTASLVDALNEIGNYFDSPVLRRTVGLFAKGIRSGGQLTRLLSSSTEEVRRIQDLRAELATTTRTYVIFLGFIIIIVMPFLLSVSTQFLTVFLKLQKESVSGAGALPGNVPTFGGKVLITLDELFYISITTLVLTSMLSSSLLGMITRGRAIYGLKYFPVFASASVVMFFLARAVVGSFLSAFGGP